MEVCFAPVLMYDRILMQCVGPGCSSSMGLFLELGPCRVTSENSTAPHHESWNTNANVFFVDQPIGVGFSYAEYGEAVVRIIFIYSNRSAEIGVAGDNRRGGQGYCKFHRYFLRTLHQ